MSTQRYSWEIAPANNGYKYVGIVVDKQKKEVAAYSNDIVSMKHYMEWHVSDLNDGGGRA